MSGAAGHRRSLAVNGWWFLALAGLVVLPWHALNDGLSLAALSAFMVEDVDSASAFRQALYFGRFWFWPPIIALLLALPGALRLVPPPGAARLLIAGGALGLGAIVAQGMAIGINGWSHAALEPLFGALDDRQFGMGLGGALATFGFLFLLTDGLAQKGAFRGDRFIAGAFGLLAGAILLFSLFPVLTMLRQAFLPLDDASALTSFMARLADRKTWGLACLMGGGSCGAAWNTLVLAIATASSATALGLAFALVVTRTTFPLRRLLRLLTVLPIITPPFVIGLGLILIFGRSGLVNQMVEAVSGQQLGRWIYGFQGVYLAQVFSFTPTAFLVLIGVVEGISPAMEEAAAMLRASRGRIFGTITLPLMLPGLANAFLVVFVESLADFGNPIVLGGSFPVLSTEIFFSVVGAQAEFGRAATLALVLLAFALGAFALQRMALGRRSYVSMTGKGDSGFHAALPDGVTRAAFLIAIPWSLLTLIVYGLALAGGLVKVWGRDWTPTLSHFGRAFSVDVGASPFFTGSAWPSLFTTLELAAIAAPLTAGLGLLAAWLLSRQRFRGITTLEFALMLTFAMPGTVIGVSYILAFNVPPLEITGTGLILVLCFIFRNLPVGVRSGMAAISQLDRSLDEASWTLNAGSWTTLRRVVLPLIRPAIVSALIYAFVRAMTTVSAVIFLVSAEYEMATVFIINRAINGDYGLAIAYSSVMILLMLGAIGLAQLIVGQRRIGRRSDAGGTTTMKAEAA